ncbi:MAG: hypothetical protein R3191_07220 [Anaerolineales bacterium]|nr:hypothetical protein [Anaerolineales bacterium]
MFKKYMAVTVVWLALAACGTGGQSPGSGEGEAGGPTPPPATFNPEEMTALAEAGLATPVTPDPGFQELEAEVGGISLAFPDDWLIADGVSGQLIVLQSFPPEEAGTEGIPRGEAKCDLVARQDVDSLEEAMDTLAADDSLNILRQESRTTARGLDVTVLEAESSRAGPMTIVLTENQGEVVMLSCIGESEQFGGMIDSMYTLD